MTTAFLYTTAFGSVNEPEKELPSFVWTLPPAFLPAKGDFINHQGKRYQVINRRYETDGQSVIKIIIWLHNYE